MPEEHKSISDARNSFLTLSEDASEQFNRYIITNKGQPQSVLLGYNDYRSLKAASQILQQRSVLEDIEVGVRQIQEGQGLSLDEVETRLRKSASKNKQEAKLTDAVAEIAGVDSETVARVLGSFASIAMNPPAEGAFDLPGGSIMIPEPGPTDKMAKKSPVKGRILTSKKDRSSSKKGQAQRRYLIVGRPRPEPPAH